MVSKHWTRTDTEVEASFKALADRWSAETQHLSNVTKIITHDAYLQIIGLGIQAVPYILRDLEHGGGPWFVALHAITHEDPVREEHESDYELMKRDWLDWGKQNG